MPVRTKHIAYIIGFLHISTVTSNVVITYISCFNKMLVKGLVPTVLYSSGRTVKVERGKSLSSQFKGNGECAFPLEESTLYQAIQTFPCKFSSAASGHNIFILLPFFPEDINSL